MLLTKQKQKANFPFSCDSFGRRVATFGQRVATFGQRVATFGRRVATSPKEGSEYHQTILKLSFGTTKMVADANKIFVCLFLTKSMEVFTGLILYIRSLIKVIIVDMIYSI